MRLQLNRWVAAVVAVALTLGDAARADDSTSKVSPPPTNVTANARAFTTLYADSDHVTVLTPVVLANVANPVVGWALDAHYLADIVSAASVDIVATASRRWHEVRHAGAVGGSYSAKPVTIRGSAAVSREPDQSSLGGAGSVAWDLANVNLTLILGFGHTRETIGRTGTSFDVFSRQLDVNTLNGGVTLTLDRATLLSLVGDVTFENGDQSKPYRYVPLFSAAAVESIGPGASLDTVMRARLPAQPREALPESRQRASVTVRLGHRSRRSTLRVDDRLYGDSWGLLATTIEARYYQDVGRRLTVCTRARMHAQAGASFYRLAYVGEFENGVWRAPRFRAGDRELGPLATLGLGLGGKIGIGPGTRPSELVLGVDLWFIHTAFFEALYASSRDAIVSTVGVEGGFE